MVWVSMVKPLWITSFKSVCPKIFMSSRVKGIFLINKSYVSAIDKTTVASCLEVSKKKPDCV